MPNIGEVTEVDDQTARQLFPALGEIHGALHLAGAARVDGDYMRRALLGGARHFGTDVRFGDASLMVEGSRVAGVNLDGERIPTDGVVVANGAWTNSLLEPLGVMVAVAPQRGQILHLTMPNHDTSGWPIIGGTGDQYILAFGPNRIVSGATRETGSGIRCAQDGRWVQDHLRPCAERGTGPRGGNRAGDPGWAATIVGGRPAFPGAGAGVRWSGTGDWPRRERADAWPVVGVGGGPTGAGPAR
jgi:D-amino-acid dehydrogenase